MSEGTACRRNDMEPTVDLAARFSSPGAKPTPWPEARAQLESAEVYWLSTVRPDGRPQVTPLIAVWVDNALYFCTGPDERKAKNLAVNPECALTTGRNSIDEGLDVVVEGETVNVQDRKDLQRIADAYVDKYGTYWTFTVGDGVFHHQDGGIAIVYKVEPQIVFAFAKGEPFSQTRYRFAPPAGRTSPTP
jgi:uncharacterized pyridoxamine 5'-phosphate oxidase family protein